ncbi:MAG: serine/threonine protein kinase [Candidatus Helarchaeota archaeon]|nr:serine/threonine protein kinase [Candidatus Helarchaeota archaeon]
MEQVIKHLKKLETDDFRVLRAIEKGMQKYKHVPISEIGDRTKFDVEYVNYILDRLHKRELINRWSEKYVGYHVNQHGYDCLALNVLVQSDVIESFGKSVGIGKEADVYEGLTPDEEVVAIKIHRLGRISFRQTKRYRDYTADKHHLSWLYTSRLAAEKEYEALMVLYPLKIAVPKPYGQNRHIVVMSNIVGDDLFTIKELKNPDKIFDTILKNIEKSYRKAQIIHGDLSEFNIIITPKFKPLLIDWPQWVSITHPNALFYLERDITNVCNFFEKKFKIFSNPQFLVEKITKT